MTKVGIMRVTAVLGFLLLLLATAAPSSAQGGPLQAQEQGAGGVTVKVEPVSASGGAPMAFEITLDTHSADLGADLTQVVELDTGGGATLRPTGWEGSPPGGHHRSGVLSFPPLPEGATMLRLILRDIAGVPERVFEWSLP